MEYESQQDKHTMDPGELNLLQQLGQSINNFWTKKMKNASNCA